MYAQVYAPWIVHSASAVNLKSPSGPDPGDPWNNENRDRRLQFWPLRQLGDLHSKDITHCQNYVLSTSEFVLVRTVVAWGDFVHLPELWLS